MRGVSHQNSKTLQLINVHHNDKLQITILLSVSYIVLLLGTNLLRIVSNINFNIILMTSLYYI